MDNLVTLVQLNRSIGLKPNEINSGIDDTLLFKLKEEVEGKCIKEGYAMPNSVEIVNRSLGEVQLSHFNEFNSLIEKFFDNVLVNDKKTQIKNNRIKLLESIRLNFEMICKFQLLKV